MVVVVVEHYREAEDRTSKSFSVSLIGFGSDGVISSREMPPLLLSVYRYNIVHNNDGTVLVIARLGIATLGHQSLSVCGVVVK